MKRLVAIGGVAAGAIGFGLARRHRQLGDVAPELRSPVLYVPMSFKSDRTVRTVRRLSGRPSLQPVDGVGVREESIPGSGGDPAVRVLVYEPAERTTLSGALLWIHGGGFVIGTPELGHALCSRFATELDIVVVSVDYRLAPEDPFPAGLDDCYRALVWLHEQAVPSGIDPTRVAVGGDSAGGGLAACVAQVALDRGGPSVCFQLLEYPMLDDRTTLHEDRDGLVWTQASNRYAWGAYLGHPPDPIEPRPYASAARRDDLTELPPAWIGVGDIDMFHDEDVEYAERLRAAGVDVDLVVVQGMYHGADNFAAESEPIVEFRNAMLAALGNAVGTPRSQPAGT